MIKLILVIVVRTLTDISFKAAVNNLHFDSIHSLKKNTLKLTTNRYLWLGICFGILNVYLWTQALQTIDLSYAYPFLSIAYITIILLGKYLFQEHIGKNKGIGITLIAIGSAILFLG